MARVRLRLAALALGLAGGILLPGTAPGSHAVAAGPDTLHGSASACDAPGAASGPLRVLFVGDSMTQGRSGSATYRYWVWRGLREAGVRASFVGPREVLARTPAGVAPLASYEHHGHGFADQLWHAGTSGAGFLTLPDRPGPLARRYSPDVVVLQLGFNDANIARAAPAEIARRTGAFVRGLWRVDRRDDEPLTRVVLGQIPQTRSSGSGSVAAKNATTRRANALVRADLAEPCVVEVNDLRVAEDPAWEPAVHTYDGAHPNAVGETLMAQRMLDALGRLGVPVDVEVYDAHETWDPHPRVEVHHQRGRTWRISWAAEAARVGADRWALRITRPGARPRTTGWLDGTETVRVLEPGTTVEAVATRGDTPGAMVSLPGPATTLR